MIYMIAYETNPRWYFGVEWYEFYHNYYESGNHESNQTDDESNLSNQNLKPHLP